MKYITKPKDEYPLDFFGLRDNKLPETGMLYFIERRLLNLSFLPVVDFEAYIVKDGKWIKGRSD